MVASDAAAARYVVGVDRVEHASFGRGSVVGRAGDKLTIDFDDGTKKILLARAVVPVVGESSTDVANARRVAAAPQRAATRDKTKRARLERQAAGAHDMREKLARLAARDADYLARRDAGATVSTGDVLLDAVLARPDDELARAQLERQHRASWLGPLASHLEEVELVRGFLDSARVRYTLATAEPRLLEHPLWSTARQLVTDNPDVALDLLTHPVLRSLRRASLQPSGLARIAARREPAPLEAVIGRSSGAARNFNDEPTGLPFPRGMTVDDPSAWAAALEVGALVNLKALEISLAPDDDSPVAFGSSRGPYKRRFADNDARRISWLLDSPLGEQLVGLDVTVGSSPTSELALGGWVLALHAHPRLRRVIVRIAYRSTVRVEWIPDGEIGSWRADEGVIAFVLERDAHQISVRIQTDAELVNGLLLLDRIRGCLEGFPMQAVGGATFEHFFPRPGSERWLEPIRAGLEPFFPGIALASGEIARV